VFPAALAAVVMPAAPEVAPAAGLVVAAAPALLFATVACAPAADVLMPGALAGLPAAAGAVVGEVAVVLAGIACIAGSIVCGVSSPQATLNSGEMQIAISATCCRGRLERVPSFRVGSGVATLTRSRLSNVVHERLIWDIFTSLTLGRL
jgi:hypothetical protein